MALRALSHIGICVSDLDASIRFYSEGLGFREIHRLKVEGELSGKLLGLDPLQLEAIYLERDGTRIELLHYLRPGCEGSPEPVAMNTRGLTHISLRTDDLDADLEALCHLGARTLEQTLIDNPKLDSRAIFVTDPDGTRIELVETPGDPHQLPGAG